MVDGRRSATKGAPKEEAGIGEFPDAGPLLRTAGATFAPS